MKIILFFLRLLPLRFRISIFFKYKQGYFPSFSNPITLSEKIQLRKLNLTKSDAQMADKYAVRQYVKNRIGEQYLIPFVGVYDNLDLSALNSIPFNSVIKTTHGSGRAHIHFFEQTSNKNQVISQFKKALEDDYIGSIFGESHYDLIERKIMVEEKLDFEGDSPPDFKFHVFRKGEQVNWVLQVDFDRFTDHKRNYYDSDMNQLDLQVIYDNGQFQLPSYGTLKQMSELAIKLNGEYNYSRVDLYLHNEQIYFGEITLTPGSGFERFSSKSIDTALGNLWG